MKTHLGLIVALCVLFIFGGVPIAAQDSDAYPVTLEHKFGAITLEERPERIVVLGYTEQDPYFALGVAPVAIRYWYGDAPNAIFPWAVEAAGDAEPEVLEMPYGTLNYEAILALEPDLISAIDAGLTEEEYETLTQIAPTLVESAEYVRFGSPWQDTTLTIGTALGMTEEAETLIADLEAKLETVRENNPAFEGATVAVAYNSLGSYGYYTGQDSRGRFFTDLGFIVPDELNEIAGDNFFADISEERVELLDRDLLVFLALQFFEDGSAAAREAIETDPLIQQLEVAQDGRILYIDDQYDDALQFSTVLSIEFLLDNLVPEIAEILPSDATAETASITCDDGFRPFTDTVREVCVPETPERIVAIHDINAGAQVLSLGGPVVGLASREDGFRDDITRYFDVEGLVDVGNVYEPNLERILQLEPDLIVHEGFDGQLFLIDEDMLATLEEIAPVVAIDAFRPVEAVMADYQELLGDAATVSLDEQQAEFETLLGEIESVLGDEWNATTASFVDVAASDGNLQIWGPTALVPLDILTRVGTNWVSIMEEAGNDENGGFIGGVSLERIDELNADLSLVDVRFSPETVDNPLYQQLTAVEAGQVIILDEPFSGTHYPNYIATAQILLDGLTALEDIDTGLVEEAAETTDASCDDGFHTVTDATGADVCLPENPERIVALSEVDIDALLSLGVEPVAVTDGRGQNTAPGFLLDALPTDVVSTGRFFQPNLEVVLSVEPDLILFAGFSDPDVLAQLNAIAPVYNAATFAESWQVHIGRVGEALGLEEEAAAVVAGYESRIASLQEQLTGQGGSEFVVVRWAPEGPQIMAPRTISSQILIDLGLTPPAEIPELEEGHAHTPPLSLETLDLIDVDWAFVGTLQSEGDAVEALSDTLESPLFQALSIVQNERLVVVDGSIWTSVGGAMGASIILDDIEAALLSEAA